MVDDPPRHGGNDVRKIEIKTRFRTCHWKTGSRYDCVLQENAPVGCGVFAQVIVGQITDGGGNAPVFPCAVERKI